MEKIWFIKIDNRKFGPYSPSDLKRDKRVTPDTLVWREGFADWVPMRFVEELNSVFEDDASGVKAVIPKDELGKDEIALDYSAEPPNNLWLIVAIALIMTYLVSQFLWNH